MALPRVLWIRHLADTPTADIGTFSGLRERLQFFGSVLALPGDSSIPPALSEITPPRRWQAVLHRFQFSGVYLGTDAWSCPEGLSEAEGVLLARERLALWLAKFHGMSFQDIHIRPFKAIVDGVRFGLLKGSKGLSLVLQPNSLSFQAPWTGYSDESPLRVRA